MKWLVFVATYILSTSRLADAQVGVTVCACQPDFYEFTLDFALSCNDTDITREMPGINDTSCEVNPVGSQNVSDPRPVVVTSVQILELGPPPDFPILFETTIPLELSDGGKFNYTSVAAVPQTITPETLPSGLQLSITGRNQNEEELLNYWLIVYDNDCGIWPLLTEGQKIGWTVFSGLGAPSQFICPVAPADVTEYPSDSPSAVPTPAVSPAPAIEPTVSPQTEAPSVSCPPIVENRDRILRVGPRTPAPSALCPEPPHTEPQPQNPQPQKPQPQKPQPVMKKVKGEGGGSSKSKVSKSNGKGKGGKGSSRRAL